MSILAHPQMHITPEDKRWAKDASARFGVEAALHREDFILHFLFNNPTFAERREALEYYFFDGHRSAQKLTRLLAELDVNTDAPFSLLEFASGFGCVTRHFKNACPKAAVTSCDIHPKAMSFISERLGGNIYQSVSNPDDFAPKSTSGDTQSYDCIFALSFFSHMPAKSWTRWLRALTDSLSSGGVLVFTTQGKNSARNHFGNPTIPENGFLFIEDSEQKDLDTAEYGQTLVTRDFVFSAIENLPNTKLEMAAPAYWWTHQDCWAIRKT